MKPAPATQAMAAAVTAQLRGYGARIGTWGARLTVGYHVAPAPDFDVVPTVQVRYIPAPAGQWVRVWGPARAKQYDTTMEAAIGAAIPLLTRDGWDVTYVPPQSEKHYCPTLWIRKGSTP